MNIAPLPAKLSFTVTLALASLVSATSIVSAQVLQLPEAPDTGTPRGIPTPGGTRTGDGELETACRQTDMPPTSLLATNNIDFTLSAYPTFWFYIPYASSEIGYIEFNLLHANQPVYRTAIKAQQPGIVAISVPQEARYALEAEKEYRWHLTLTCASAQDEPDLDLTGWVQRVSSTPELTGQLEAHKDRKYAIFVDQDILYDAVTDLAALRRLNPEDPQLQTEWTNLLKLLGWQELAQEPFVESDLIPPQEQATTSSPLE